MLRRLFGMGMRIKQENIINIIYLFVFILSVLLEKPSIMCLSCAITMIGLISKKQSIENAFIISLICGSEVACYLNLLICVVYLFGKKRWQRTRSDGTVVVLLSFLGIGAFVNMVINVALYNTVFSLLYYVLLIIIVISVKRHFDASKVVNSIKASILIEMVCGVLIIIKTRDIHPGDIHCGTFSDANYLVIYLVAVLYYLVCYYRQNGYSIIRICKTNFIYLLGDIVFILLGSAKNVLAAFCLAAIVYLIAKLFTGNQGRRIIISVAIIYIGILCGILVVQTHIVEQYVNKYARQQLGIYFYDSDYSFKYDYFKGTCFDELIGPRLLLGYGVGQYGSRFANMFGYNSMHREETSINKFVSANFSECILPNYKKYASKYSDDIVKEIRWRSAILTYPFSSIIAFIGENGLIGVFLFVYIWSRLGSKSKYGFLTVFLFAVCIFDVYFEHIGVAAMILGLLVCEKRRNDLEIVLVN